MMRVLINQGFGDHIICNGLVRTLAGQYGGVQLYVTPLVERFAKRMYRDDGRIGFLPLGLQVGQVMAPAPDLINLSTSYGGFKYHELGKTFSEAFYMKAGLDEGVRWSGFYVEREKESEGALYRSHGVGKYIFVHQDVARGGPLNKKFIRPDTRIIYSNNPVLSWDLFAYLRILENAEEIHTICSSFLCLVDTIPFKPRGKLIFHEYIRKYGIPNKPWDHPTLRKDWKVIT